MICSLKLKKDGPILKMLLWICAFGFEAIPHPSCYLAFITDKTHHRPVIAFFCATSVASSAMLEVP